MAASLLAAGLFAGAAQASTLKPMVTLTAAVVKLSDLFDGLAPGADRALGPAPPPGGRITVEAAQLGAIAREFGVDWHPYSAYDRVILDRPGRLLQREDVLAAVRKALMAAGHDATSDVDLPGYSPLLVAEGPAEITVDQLEQDQSSGRFTAVATVVTDGVPAQRLRLAGRVQDTVELPVAAHRLLPGTLLRADDVTMARIRVGLVQTDMARVPRDAVGMVLRHQMLPGAPFPLADLARQAAVQRGDRIMMVLTASGIDLTAQGVAMEGGAVGDQISVQNPNSHAVLQAEITGPAQVRIAPGSTPVNPATRGLPPQVALR